MAKSLAGAIGVGVLGGVVGAASGQLSKLKEEAKTAREVSLENLRSSNIEGRAVSKAERDVGVLEGSREFTTSEREAAQLFEAEQNRLKAASLLDIAKAKAGPKSGVSVDMLKKYSDKYADARGAFTDLPDKDQKYWNAEAKRNGVVPSDAYAADVASKATGINLGVLETGGPTDRFDRKEDLPKLQDLARAGAKGDKVSQYKLEQALKVLEAELDPKEFEDIKSRLLPPATSVMDSASYSPEFLLPGVSNRFGRKSENVYQPQPLSKNEADWR